MILNDTATLNGILQDIYFNGKITASTFSANDLLRIVNKYYKMLQGDLRAVNEDFFVEISTTDIVANTGGTYPNEYPWPQDYEKIKNLLVAMNPVNLSAPLNTEFQRVQIIDANSVTDPSYVFSSPTAQAFADSFLLWPLLPAYPVRGVMKCFYIPIQPDLAADTDKPNIFADYHDAITWGSLIDIGHRMGRENLQKKAELMFKSRRQEMKDYASSKILDGQSSVIEGQNQGNWMFPFGQNGMS